jgi:nicotinamide/nicotinate riboside kinase
MKAALIAIGGISRSGKSTLAYLLAERLSLHRHSCEVISQDDFCLPSGMLPLVKGIPDWEQPESMDWDRYHEKIYQASKQHQYLIIEGLFVFDDPVYRKDYSCEIELEIDHETFMNRRNVEQRWGKEPEWYIRYVWEVYQQRNPKPIDGLILSGETSIDLDALTLRIL